FSTLLMCYRCHRPPLPLLPFPTRRSSDLTRDFERAVRLGAADGPTLCDLGIAYQQTLNFQAARQSYQRVLSQNPLVALAGGLKVDRKSTRLNSSHDQISYAVFCLKTKTKR